MLREFLTAFLGLMGDVITFVMDNPIILVVVMVALVGIVISVVKRFLPGGR
jgi:uncharacterized membrane protein (DUF106 family)